MNRARRVSTERCYTAELLGLTTVAQPVFALGVLAAEMILTALTDPEQPLPAVIVPTELIVRGTTGPAPR
jgi:DNA-binding LacI/PurR family transcriptional regulator